ncbi:MAG: ATP-binding protein, partial [Candidatus Thermoplasmatota archaeon]|nr:ATP-binding protein [Candidatus Thermoplasmatota archaeon]
MFELMPGLAPREPEFIGRQQEFSFLEKKLQDIQQSNGATVLLAGEAGIGKTRLVTEFFSSAKDAKIIRGWCMAESLEPLMPVREALRSAGLQHLVSGAAPPRVASAYLMNEAGLLIAKVEREESGLDPDIFASMLTAVGTFVQDTLAMMGDGQHGGLNSLGYGKYRILVQTHKGFSLALVMEGMESEFLVDDMNRILLSSAKDLVGWGGDMAGTEKDSAKLAWLIESGKYDGAFLVDDPKLRRENLFDNILLGIQRATEQQPMIIFLDDLQWADPTT